MTQSALFKTSPQVQQSLQGWDMPPTGDALRSFLLGDTSGSSYTDGAFGLNYNKYGTGGGYTPDPGVNPTMMSSLGQWGSGALGAVGGGFRAVGSGIARGLGWGQQTPRMQSLVGLEGDARQLAIQENQQLLWNQQNSLGKMNAFSNTLNAVGGIGQLYLGLEQLDIAKENAELAKLTFATNLKNSTQAYNTQLKERRRRSIERSTGAQADAAALKAYMDEHGL